MGVCDLHRYLPSTSLSACACFVCATRLLTSVSEPRRRFSTECHHSLLCSFVFVFSCERDASTSSLASSCAPLVLRFSRKYEIEQTRSGRLSTNRARSRVGFPWQIAWLSRGHQRGTVHYHSLESRFRVWSTLLRTCIVLSSHDSCIL